MPAPLFYKIASTSVPPPLPARSASRPRPSRASSQEPDSDQRSQSRDPQSSRRSQSREPRAIRVKVYDYYDNRFAASSSSIWSSTSATSTSPTTPTSPAIPAIPCLRRKISPKFESLRELRVKESEACLQKMYEQQTMSYLDGSMFWPAQGCSRGGRPRLSLRI